MGSQEPPAEANQTVQAFNDMSRKLAGLTAAVDGFAARQQELHARDYGPDLEKIRDGYDKVCGAINILAKRPAMTLTPQDAAPGHEQIGKKTGIRPAGARLRQGTPDQRFRLGIAIQPRQCLAFEPSSLGSERTRLGPLVSSALGSTGGG
ncbi:hypothetical protein [uncultured Sphingomonas sp.]|uniref:hypothetical protein n=1 Tax=uncultured Sphingomonas sp. TaxID=158754 RepID=UPI0025E2FBF7|nr:hypothetical protein [uncultured Sphingomonas sp.]